MSKKIIFLDVDGTILDHHGQVPASAMEALHQTRAKGNYVFLCTGRARVEIVGVLSELPLDGIVCAAGAHVEIDGKVIVERYMTLEQVKEINRFFSEKEVDYILEGPAGVFASKGFKAAFINMLEERIRQNEAAREQIIEGMSPLLNAFKDNCEMDRADINKVCFRSSHTTFAEIEEHFKAEFIVLPNSIAVEDEHSGELMQLGVHKAKGIEDALAYLGLTREDAYAFGDGYNDLEMLQYVGCGIAMGNSCEALKKVADDLTDAVDQDGLYNGFKKHGLL